MYLTSQEEKMLEGEYGPSIQKSMEILVALGDIYNAEKLVNICLLYTSDAADEG